MEKVFLSYTYRPHPDHEANLERLRRCVVRAIEAMGLRIIDGVDVGGRPLDDALRRRIQDADALIALVTPQAAPVFGRFEAARPNEIWTGDARTSEAPRPPSVRCGTIGSS